MSTAGTSTNVEGGAVPVALLGNEAVAAAPALAPANVVHGPPEVSPPLVDPVVVFTNASARNMRTASASYEILFNAYRQMTRVVRQARRFVGPGGDVLPGLDINKFRRLLRTMAGRLAYYTPDRDVFFSESSDDEASSVMSDNSVGSVIGSFDCISDNTEDMS
jgi:hypothetical protein